MTMKYRLRLLCAGLLFCSMQSAAAQETVQTLSPNGKLAITVSLQNGAPRYEVTYQGKPVVLESALGINGNGDWSRGMRIAGVTRSSRDTGSAAKSRTATTKALSASRTVNGNRASN